MNERIDKHLTTFDRPRPTRALAWALAAVWFIGVPARTMAAPKLCIPEVSGVPALSGAPNWYNDVGAPQYWPRLDDPRWQGALAKSWGTGSIEHVQFRALRDNNAVYLSWWVRVDPDLSQSLDLLYVAFSPGGGAPDRLISISPMGINQDLTVSVGPVVAPSTETRLRNAPGNKFGAVISPAPDWLSNAPGKTKTRVWLDALEKSWAINMVVPISQDPNLGLPLQSTFQLWFELQVSTSGPPNNTMAFYRLIDSVPFDDVDQGTDATTWATMVRTDNPADTAGCEKAISITSDDVGTYNTDANNIARPNQISLTASNKFFARPTNGTGNTIAQDTICAQFRLANWGSQPDWNDVPDPLNSLWKLISPPCVPPGGRLNSGPIAPGAKAGPGNEISFDWTVTHTPGIPDDIDRCDFVGKSGVPAQGIPPDPSCPNATPTRKLHQCMLVELSGGGLTYTPASVFRNMDFVNASTFEREAEISVAGLANLVGATDRDVYLYVKTLNMPATGSSTKLTSVLRDLEQFEKYSCTASDEEGNGCGSGSGSGSGGSGDKDPHILREGRGNGDHPGPDPLHGRSPSEPFDTLEQVLPTYVVHAYYDTGRVVKRGAVTSKVLRPQSSFGYYVLHEGPLHGWSTLLQGAQQIGPNFYRISVPQGGRRTVKTTIIAHESTPCQGCCCSRTGASSTTPKVSTLGLVVLVGAVLVRRRRRSRR